MLEKMEVASIGNAKVSDSAYSNGYSNSQSQNSSDGSVSRNSNRSNSSGYCGRQTFSFSNEALPQPISKRKDNEHKKKQSKTTSAAANIESSESFLNNTPVPPNAISYTITQPPTQPSAEKSEKTTIAEPVDVTDPGKHNSDFISDPEAGFAAQSDARDDPDTQIDEGFCVAMSMHDGTVIHVTPSIYTSLGFSKESWIGSSFIDFIHPKHRASFADRIIDELLSPQAKRSKGFDSQQASLFCALRRFKPSKCNDTADNAHRNSRSSLRYLPFRLILTFKTFQETSATEHPQLEAVFLVIAAQPVHSAYKAPEETIISSKFTTRHTATCHLSHVDTGVIQYFGYLPQDMVGRSLFDFYHPEDLPFIKDIYETVMKSEGSSFRSKPYRFAVQNGGYVVLETEWSSFINPWSRKLEFVVGQHRVLKGPANPDVFQPADECDPGHGADHISEEVMKESKIIQSEICALLDQSISKSDEYSEQNSSERCKELASFMENLQQGVKTLAQSKDAAGVDRGFSEHDSVMLCKMSPHHEYYDSKSSTETPPSYNQLNYNDNLERFFKSKPLVTTMYCSDEENVNSSTPSNDEAGKSSPVLPAENCTLALDESGASRSRSGTAESLSNSPANRNNPSTSDASNSNARSNETFKPPILTESLLSKHNEDMEKQMMQMHRERRSGIKNNDKMTKSSRFKRSGSPSREARNVKISKYEEAVQTTSAATMPTNNGATSMSVDQKPVTEQNAMNNTIQPPLSITVTPSLQPCITHTAHNMYPQAISRFPVQVIPMYCFPVPHGKDTSTAIRQDKPEPSNTSALQPLSQSPYIQYVATGMAGVLYPPVAKAPMPTAATYSSFLTSESSAPVIQEAPCSAPEKSADWKKVLSPGELLSSSVSVDGGCSSFVDPPTTVNAKVHRQIDCNSDESSCSSFCSTTYRNTSSDSSYTSNQRIPELLREKTRAQDGSCEHAYAQEELHRQEQQQKHHQQQQQNRLRKKEPPWLEGVSITPELIYEYQLRPRTLSEILQSDRDALKKITQPTSVNDQLDQLYLDLEFDGFEAKLMLEDSVTSNGSESDTVDSENDVNDQCKHGRHMAKYHKLAMIHEENAPFPPIQTLAS